MNAFEAVYRVVEQIPRGCAMSYGPVSYTHLDVYKRQPRTFAAVAVGAALALSGCVMQNVLRNPLASASTLGVSQGASFGAAVAIVCLGGGMQILSLIHI